MKKVLILILCLICFIGTVNVIPYIITVNGDIKDNSNIRMNGLYFKDNIISQIEWLGKDME